MSTFKDIAALMLKSAAACLSLRVPAFALLLRRFWRLNCSSCLSLLRKFCFIACLTMVNCCEDMALKCITKCIDRFACNMPLLMPWLCILPIAAKIKTKSYMLSVTDRINPQSMNSREVKTNAMAVDTTAIIAADKVWQTLSYCLKRHNCKSLQKTKTNLTYFQRRGEKRFVSTSTRDSIVLGEGHKKLLLYYTRWQ